MPGSPVRLAIASPDEALARGLRRLLAEQSHRVVVVDDAGPVDVVLHDADAAGMAVRDTPRSGNGVPVWVPLRSAIEGIVAMVEAAAAGSPEPTDGDAGLSAREVEVLALIAEGLTNQEIADRVFVSINSVKTYIRSAYRKIGVHSRSQAAVWAHQQQIVRRRP